MSYVCLWSPRWPTGADFPADLVASLLTHAPRIAVGERGLVWADARGLNGTHLAEALLHVASDYGFDDVHAGVAMTPIAAEVAATHTAVHEGELSSGTKPMAQQGGELSPGTEPMTLQGGEPSAGAQPVAMLPSSIGSIARCAPALGSPPHPATNSPPNAAAAHYLITVKPGTDATFLAPHPLHVLSPSEPIAALLHGLGIETCGALGSLDAESIEVRLGVEGVRLWQRARAEETPWLFRVPMRPLPSASVEWVEYGLRDPERLLFIINSLAGTVCTALVARGERARDMGLVFALGNRTQRTHTIRSSRPSSEQKRWLRLAREALDTITLPEAVMGVTLRVEAVVGDSGAQGDLFDRGFATAPAVEDAIIQLTDDQGDVVVEPVNSEHPMLDQRTAWVPRAAKPGGLLLETTRLQRTTYLPSSPSLTLQLLPTPRVVTVEVEPRRDHEIPIRYLDGAEWHDLVEAAGPDRVSGGMWNVEYARDYFRCVREDGMMVWLYRGLSQANDWFLHGWWD